MLPSCHAFSPLAKTVAWHMIDHRGNFAQRPSPTRGGDSS